MITPRLSRDRASKILSLTLTKKKACESEMYRKILLEYDKEGEIVRISILPFSLEEFGKSQPMLQVRPSFGTVGNISIL